MPLAAHKYAPGVRLLCFEPDPSKAKLIYYAEVTSLCGHALKGRSRVPQYFVHFLGWKRKWDREVCEDLLLEKSEFNKTLKRKIDEVATHVKDKEKRTERIDLILSGAATAHEDIDWDNLPGTWKGLKHTSSDRDFKIADKYASTLKNQPQSPQSFSDYYEETEDMDSDELAQANFEAIGDHNKFSPNVQLPQSLYSILETHCRFFEDQTRIQSKRSQKSLSWCCALDLLEAYIHGFPYNLSIANSTTNILDSSVQFSSASQRERFSRMAAAEYLKTDRSRHLCAEFCSSVRILFDALLVKYLLYPTEEKQHTPFMRNVRNRSSTPLTPNLSANGLHFTLLPQEEIETNPSLPCLTYEAVYLLRLLVRLPALVNQMALSKCRQSIVLRHLALFIKYLEESRDFWFTDVRPSTPNPFTSKLQQNNNGIDLRTSSSQAVPGSSTNSASLSSPTPYRHSLPSTSAVQHSRRSLTSTTKPRSIFQASSTRSRNFSTIIDPKEKPDHSQSIKPINQSDSESSSALKIPQQIKHRSLRSSGPMTTVEQIQLAKKRLLKKEEEFEPPKKLHRITRVSAVTTPPPPPPSKPKIKSVERRITRSSLPVLRSKRKDIPKTVKVVKSSVPARNLRVRNFVPVSDRTRMRSICSL